MDTLEIDRIRISTLQTSRFERSMEIYQQFVFCSGFSRFTVKLNYLLVVTVHKINLETFDSHLCVVADNLFHGRGDVASSRKIAPACPEDDAYALLVAVCHQFFEIDFGTDVFH